VIAPGIKRRSSASRPNAVEERDVLLRVEEARHPFVLCAMLPSNERRAVDLAVIAYLGRTRIALEQKGLRPGAGRAQRPEEKCKKEQPNSGAITAAQSEASINDWMS
jgi:hypothetical protein